VSVVRVHVGSGQVGIGIGIVVVVVVAAAAAVVVVVVVVVVAVVVVVVVVAGEDEKDRARVSQREERCGKRSRRGHLAQRGPQRSTLAAPAGAFPPRPSPLTADLSAVGPFTTSTDAPTQPERTLARSEPIN
jgi:hypothetical protein